jgi:sortase A
MKGTAEPGTKGNCVLAGHRGGIYGEFFKHLNKLKKKDKVKITDAMGREYNYQVYDQFVVEPTDVYVTNSIKEEKTLTLVTCENNGTKRLIVRCRLTD